MPLYGDCFLVDKSTYYKEVDYDTLKDKAMDFMVSRPVPAELVQYNDEKLKLAAELDKKAAIYVKRLLRNFVLKGRYRLEDYSLDETVQLLFEDMYGLGAIDSLVNDPNIQEVTVNGTQSIWVERADGKVVKTNKKYRDERSLKNTINRLSRFGLGELSPQKPEIQIFMPDKSRVYIAGPPMADTFYINYRKFSVFKPTEENYIASGSLTKEAIDVIGYLTHYGANFLIVGPQSSGKTTLLNFMSTFYPKDFRIGTLESEAFEADIKEFNQEGNIFSLKTVDHLDIDELDIFKTSLRFSARVVLMPEARGKEMDEVLKVSRRGGYGSISCIHSKGPYACVDDIISMLMETGKNYKFSDLRRMVAKSLDIVVTMNRDRDGSRKVVNISELDYDDKAEKVTVTPLFDWQGGKLVRTNNGLTNELIQALIFNGADEEKLLELGLLTDEYIQVN